MKQQTATIMFRIYRLTNKRKVGNKLQRRSRLRDAVYSVSYGTVEEYHILTTLEEQIRSALRIGRQRESIGKTINHLGSPKL